LVGSSIDRVRTVWINGVSVPFAVFPNLGGARLEVKAPEDYTPLAPQGGIITVESPEGSYSFSGFSAGLMVDFRTLIGEPGDEFVLTGRLSPGGHLGCLTFPDSARSFAVPPPRELKRFVRGLSRQQRKFVRSRRRKSHNSTPGRPPQCDDIAIALAVVAGTVLAAAERTDVDPLFQ
jgi:hypothetical protein